MRGLEVVAVVIIAFFVIGIGVGVLLVIALPAFRQRRDAPDIGWNGEYRRRPGRLSGYGGYGWEEPPGPEDDDPARWPGDRRG